MRLRERSLMSLLRKAETIGQERDARLAPAREDGALPTNEIDLLLLDEAAFGHQANAKDRPVRARPAG